MIKVQYVFWDSDNTLINTAEHHWRKHVETLKTLDINLTDDYRKRVYENNGTQNWTWMNEELGLELDCQDYLDKIDAWYFDHIDEIEIRNGVMDAIEYFSANKMPQAVVSNGRRKSVMTALEAKKLAPYFKFILCNEDYEGRKPSPVPYETALNRMTNIENRKIDPQSCLVIEDDPLGVQSGKAAGMIVLYRPIGDESPIKTLVS